VQFGQLAHDLSGHIAELDLNPVLVGPRGALAVDCLIVPKHRSRGQPRAV
jgi:hypothetical protein